MDTVNFIINKIYGVYITKIYPYLNYEKVNKTLIIVHGHLYI